MTTKGFFYDKGQPVPEGERKLYLVIEGPTELSVKRAKVCCGSYYCHVIHQSWFVKALSLHRLQPMTRIPQRSA